MRERNNYKNASCYYMKERDRWRVEYYIYDQETFKEIRKAKTFVKEKDARDFIQVLKIQRNDENYLKNNGIPFNNLMRANIEKKLEMNIIGERTYKRLMETVKQIERCDAFKKSIEQITSTDIQNYLNSLLNLSNSTIKKNKEQFNQVFRYAMNKGYISSNPMVEVIRPRSKKVDKVVRALELEEQQKLTDYLMNVSTYQEPFRLAFLLQMYMGLRIGEALALQTTDFNFDKDIATIRKTLTQDRNGNVILGDVTKTYAGMREVPIPVFLKPIIKEQIKISNDKEYENNMLFLDSKRNLVRNVNVNRSLKKILSQLGIEGISSHSLRHTYGTRCVEAGMRAVALQRLMGHTDISVTLNTYTSVFNKYKESELEKVNDYYISNQLIVPPSTILLDKNGKEIDTEER